MIKEAGIVFDELEPEAIDMPYGTVSGAGVIFGVTGGVTEAVLRRVVANKSRSELMTIANIGQRGNEGIKEFEIAYGENALKLVVVSGLANAEAVIKRMKAGEHFDFIEVMACPGGCVNGGGQPFALSEDKKNRSKALYDVDKLLPIRRAEENPIVNALYEDVLEGRTHELLHVHYGKKH